MCVSMRLRNDVLSPFQYRSVSGVTCTPKYGTGLHSSFHTGLLPRIQPTENPFRTDAVLELIYQAWGNGIYAFPMHPRQFCAACLPITSGQCITALYYFGALPHIGVNVYLHTYRKPKMVEDFKAPGPTKIAAWKWK